MKGKNLFERVNKMHHGIIVYDSEKYSYHKDFALLLQSLFHQLGFQTLLKDKKERSFLDSIHSMEEQDTFFLVTCDLTGFEMGTETGSLYYNLLHCKMLHFLFGRHENQKHLTNKLSMAMFFCWLGIPLEEEAAILKDYPYMEHLHILPSLSWQNFTMAEEKFTKEQSLLKEELYFFLKESLFL